MPDKTDEVKFTLKLHPELAAKLNYIAEYYGCLLYTSRCV